MASILEIVNFKNAVDLIKNIGASSIIEFPGSPPTTPGAPAPSVPGYPRPAAPGAPTAPIPTGPLTPTAYNNLNLDIMP